MQVLFKFIPISQEHRPLLCNWAANQIRTLTSLSRLTDIYCVINRQITNVMTERDDFFKCSIYNVNC